MTRIRRLEMILRKNWIGYGDQAEYTLKGKELKLVANAIRTSRERTGRTAEEG